MTAADVYKVMTVDDHEIVRIGLQSVLAQSPNFRLVAQAANGNDMMARLSEVTPDIIILDLSMPGRNGISLITDLRRDLPQVRILILTMHKDAALMRKALKNGANGYLLKGDIITHLDRALTVIANGGLFVSGSIENPIGNDIVDEGDIQIGLEKISRREREVLSLVGKGMTSREIAGKLSISVNTVSNHRASIMQKLGIDSLTGLIRFAVESNLHS